MRVRRTRCALRLTHAAAVLAAAVPMLSGCAAAPREPGASVTWTLDPATPRVGPARLTIELRDPAGAAVTGALVAVEGHMTHAGMRPVLASAHEMRPGVYAVPLEFTMAGDWVVVVVVVPRDGRRIEHRIDVPRVRPAG